MAWLSGFEKHPRLVFVNHGEAAVTESFAEYLEKEYGYQAFAPYSGTTFDLAEERFTECPEGVPVAKKGAQTSSGNTEGANLYNKLKKAAQELESVIARSREYSNKDLRKFGEELARLVERWK